MYFFKEMTKEKKQQLLDGRSVSYLARNKTFVTPSFLCAVLSGRRGCSYRTAMNITKAIDKLSTINEFFYEDKTKPAYTKANK